MTLSFSDTEFALLQEAAATHHSTTAIIAKEILSVWFADRRAERRYQAVGSHYTERQGSDFDEVAE
jgi:hypothetical protein